MTDKLNGSPTGPLVKDANDQAQATNRRDLARQIQIVVNHFTKGRADMGVPMQAGEIIGVIAFCAGYAVGGQKVAGRVENTQQLREMAMKFFADGEAVAVGARPASEFVILPDSIQKH